MARGNVALAQKVGMTTVARTGSLGAKHGLIQNSVSSRTLMAGKAFISCFLLGDGPSSEATEPRQPFTNLSHRSLDTFRTAFCRALRPRDPVRQPIQRGSIRSLPLVIT